MAMLWDGAGCTHSTSLADGTSGPSWSASHPCPLCGRACDATSSLTHAAWYSGQHARGDPSRHASFPYVSTPSPILSLQNRDALLVFQRRCRSLCSLLACLVDDDKGNRSVGDGDSGDHARLGLCGRPLRDARRPAMKQMPGALVLICAPTISSSSPDDVFSTPS
eukprot:3782089-Rhodomonas_salina.4